MACLEGVGTCHVVFRTANYTAIGIGLFMFSSVMHLLPNNYLP